MVSVEAAQAAPRVRVPMNSKQLFYRSLTWRYPTRVLCCSEAPLAPPRGPWFELLVILHLILLAGKHLALNFACKEQVFVLWRAQSCLRSQVMSLLRGILTN